MSQSPETHSELNNRYEEWSAVPPTLTKNGVGGIGKINTMQNTQLQPKPPPAPLTLQQQVILQLLFRFRFLDRTHIQRYLHHTNHKRILLWLNDLTTKQFITRNYSKTFPNNTKPAIYHLAPTGIAWLKTQPEYDKQTLHKLYRENKRSPAFIAHSLLLATLDLKLRDQSTEAIQQTMAIKSDYPNLPQAELLAQLSPHAFITKTQDGSTKYYFLELLTDLTQARLRKRIKAIVAFYQSNEWEGATSEPFPTVLLVCPDLATMIDTKRFTKKLLTAKEATTLEVLVTTLEEVSTQGIAGEIWEGVV